MVRVWMAGKTV